MLSQSVLNVLRKNNNQRHVMSVVTQTVVNSDSQYLTERNKQIGPWLDRDRAKQRQQVFDWHVVEDPGYGFRRVVPSPPPVEIVEIEGIRQLVESGMVIITAGGGGIPVFLDKQGMLEGVEAVVDTDHVACMLAHNLNAKILLMIIENDTKFVSSGIGTEKYRQITKEELEEEISSKKIYSNMVSRKLHSAREYLQNGGHHVIITTLDNLSSTLEKRSGLWIGVKESIVDFSKLE